MGLRGWRYVVEDSCVIFAGFCATNTGAGGAVVVDVVAGVVVDDCEAFLMWGGARSNCFIC